MELRMQHESSPGQTDPVLAWLAEYRQSIDCTVERIPFGQSREWSFDAERSSLSHRSGKFFSIRGYRCESVDRGTYYQPLIDQPETGTQGFIIQRDGRQIELLVQARTEPGNIGTVQIGPSIQATYSNYTKVHQGKTPLFLDRFHHPDQSTATVILDTVQPELGSKFLHKWNRNIVIECDDLADFSHPMFRWVSLGSLCQLMQAEHVVNNDARLVVGLLALELGPDLFQNAESELGQLTARSFASTVGISFPNVERADLWFSRMREQSSLKVQPIPLSELPGWSIADDRISHDEGLYFSVVQVKVHAADREVTDWDQPLISAEHTADVTLICREHHGVLNFLFRVESQIGNQKGAQLQPTMCLDNEGIDQLPTEVAELLAPERLIQQFRFQGSDEGGRFYRYVSRYDVRWIESSNAEWLPADYCWLTLGQIQQLLARPDYISDESRSILSLFLSSVYAAEAAKE